MRKILASAVGASLLTGGVLGFIPSSSTPAFADTRPSASTVTIAPGGLAPAQADQLLSALTTLVTDVASGNRPGDVGESPDQGVTDTTGDVTGTAGEGHMSMFLSTIASTIGISEADLRAALASGESVAQIARAHNVDPQKVIDALVSAAQDKLTAAVASGQITQAEADQLLSNITQAITDLVNGTLAFAGYRHRSDLPTLGDQAGAA